MKIATDKNILFAKEAFSTLGDVKLFDSEEITAENISDFDVLLVRSTVKVNEKLLGGTKIKFVGSPIIGTDHIDIEYLNARNIAFSSAAGCNSRSVAEYVLTAIYAFCETAVPEPVEGKDLCVGIIGVGNIGGKLAEILQNLGIKTLLNDPPRSFNTPLDEIAEKCDIITVHTPLTKSGKHKTEGLLNEVFFVKMKPNALLIQASRGKICDERALVNVKNKIIDVWANEPSINWDLAQNCLFSTPHIAGHSFDGKINGTKIIYENCCNFFSEKPKFDFEKEVFSKIEKQTLEFNGSIAEILLKCCPISEDSSELLREKNFKKQRTNYRKRLEFPHYIVKNAPEEIAEELRILGFSV